MPVFPLPIETSVSLHFLLFFFFNSFNFFLFIFRGEKKLPISLDYLVTTDEKKRKEKKTC